MSVSDPIADMLTRIRNAVASRHDAVTIPASKMKVSIARVLKDEGFIRDYEVQDDGKPQPDLKVDLGYTATRQPVLNGLQRVSKPGLRVYVQRREIPRVYGGLGIAILSTPKGIMTGHEARRQQVGGELLCYIW
ncbi:MAG: 30S ribosomal protein S8 [Dehalococcoidia bacterium]|nr:30S ribosomal protein S8 [Dehalococcoidia bacterium]MCA9823913.1 30S ribosomal protein S8 [Dehalococcoidia bacterium]MCA9844053.1 30S ribosomal protein S8 [Dehalococcoidia bacterium]